MSVYLVTSPTFGLNSVFKSYRSIQSHLLTMHSRIKNLIETNYSVPRYTEFESPEFNAEIHMLTSNNVLNYLPVDEFWLSKFEMINYSLHPLHIQRVCVIQKHVYHICICFPCLLVYNKPDEDFSTVIDFVARVIRLKVSGSLLCKYDRIKWKYRIKLSSLF